MIHAIVGAGGKTSLIKMLANQYRKEGKKVFVTTSTHMYIEKDTILSDDADVVLKELEEKNYVMAGVPHGEKISPLSMETYLKICEAVDEVLIEADGSKHMPIKFPAENEPVIYDNVDKITVVYGRHGLGKKASEAVHRLKLAKEKMEITDDTILTEKIVKEMIRIGYSIPLKEKYPEKEIRIHESGAKNIGCIIMASGLAKRFGSNKLLAEFDGNTLIGRALDLTQGLFEKRVVVTRTKEVESQCMQRGIDVIYHTLPDRNDAVRLGVEKMTEMEGCLFCPCDQPLLTRESIVKLLTEFQNSRCRTEQEKGIFRLAYDQKPGTPILFGKEYFEELRHLPLKKGGSYLAKKYPDQVEYVMAMDEKELFDIDTKEDLELLLRR